MERRGVFTVGCNWKFGQVKEVRNHVDWAKGKVELDWSRRSGKFFGKSSDRPTCTVAVVFSAECRKKHKKGLSI